MLKINLIEQVAKQQEVLNIKNKVSSEFIQKTLYYSEEEPVTKAVATNTGNINASDMMGTQTVFPSDKAGADGEYLIYLMPRFVRGKNVYRLFNTESSKQIKNTVRVSNASIGNYVYQVDPTSNPEQAKEEGETVEVENTDRSVERNRANKIKPMQAEETPEQYQERFMKEYHDLVRDINGALSDIDPEQVLKQWQQKQKELEEKQIEQQAVETFTMMDEGCQQMVDAINTYTQNNCSLKQETNKSIFFETSILKAKSNSKDVCKESKDAIAEFLYKMGSQFEHLGFATSPFVEGTYSEQSLAVQKLIDKICDNLDRNGITIREIVNALDAINAVNSQVGTKDGPQRIEKSYQIPLLYLLMHDFQTISIDEDGTYVSLTEKQQKDQKEKQLVLNSWLTQVASGSSPTTQLTMAALVNEFKLSEIPYASDINYPKQMLGIAKAIIASASIANFNIAMERLDLTRPVESFFALYSKGMLQFELGRHLKAEDIPDIEIVIGMRKANGERLTEEETEELKNAAANKFRTDGNTELSLEKRKQYAEWLQSQVPTWLFKPKDPENPRPEELLKLYYLGDPNTDPKLQLKEDNPSIADLPAFAPLTGTTQFDIYHLVKTHADVQSYKDEEFEAFVDAYVDNLAKQIGVENGCSQYKGKKYDGVNDSKMDICDDLVSHVHFILGRERASIKGGNSGMGETFEEILVLDQLTRMLPSEMSEQDTRVRFNGKVGSKAVQEYLRCQSGDARHYLTQSNPKNFDRSTKVKRGKKSASIEETAEELLSGKIVTKSEIEEKAKELEATFKPIIDSTGTGFEAIPITSDKQDGNPVKLYVKQKEYSDAFYTEVQTILSALDKKDITDDEQRELLKQLDSSVFKFIMLGLVNQESNLNNIPVIISAITNFLEKDERFAKLTDKQRKALIIAFKGKAKHVDRHVRKYSTFRPLNGDSEKIVSGSTFEINEIAALIEAEKITLTQVAKTVSTQEAIDAALETELNGVKLSDWFSEIGKHFAEEILVVGADIPLYIEFFNESIRYQIERSILYGEELNTQSLLEIISKARLEGARALLKVSQGGKVSGAYTRETQEDFREKLRLIRTADTNSAPASRVFIRAKTLQESDIAPIPDRSKRNRNDNIALTEKIGELLTTPGTIQVKTSDESPSIKPDREKIIDEDKNGEEDGLEISEELRGRVLEKELTIDSTSALNGIVLAIFGSRRDQNGKLVPRITGTNPLLSIIDKYPQVHVNEKDDKGNPVSRPLNASDVAKIKRAIKTYKPNPKKPIKIKMKLMTQEKEVAGNRVLTAQRGDGYGNPPRYQLEITFIATTFNADGEEVEKEYTVTITTKSAPREYTKSVLTIDNFVLKAATAQESTDKDDRGCPKTKIGEKFNTNAMLTIHDDAGITFFNVSKLPGIPGASSGFGDIAHFRINGLTIDETGTISSIKKKDQRGEQTEDLEDISIETTVVEGKIGTINPVLRSFPRITAIQAGVIEAIVPTDRMSHIKKSRSDVFVARGLGRISYGRAKPGFDDKSDKDYLDSFRKQPAARQWGRTLVSTRSIKETQTKNINNLSKILKSIWV